MPPGSCDKNAGEILPVENLKFSLAGPVQYKRNVIEVCGAIFTDDRDKHSVVPGAGEICAIEREHTPAGA